ncbi:MAG: DUF5658 family protein [Armatimonadota bacterium]
MKGTTSRRLKVSGVFLAAIYLALSLCDYLLSLAAFQLGVPEGNPVLRWAAAHGVFSLAKVGLTLVAAILIVVLSRARQGRAVAWAGVTVMAAVNVYHMVALHLRLGPA